MNNPVLSFRAPFLGSDSLARMTSGGYRFGPYATRATRSLRLGIIASEFPPDHGGMQEHARGLVDSLACDHDVAVYVSHRQSGEPCQCNATIKPIMRWELSSDLPRLEASPVDAWITLNAGLAPYSLGLTAPLFAYVHGNDFTRPWLPHPQRSIRLARRAFGEGVVRGWRARQIARGLRGARWVFANSDFSRRLCARLHGISEDRITVVPPGMRHEFFRAGSTQPDKLLRIVTVSRLCGNAARKNIDGVLHAVARLRGEVDIAYTVIGDGDDLPRLRALARTLGLGAHAHFLGALGTEAVIEEFGRSDAFVMTVRPNDLDVEGFGMVFAEAAATGLPSIGTNTGGIPEVIEDGVTGLLLDDVSVEGIADGLRRFHLGRGNFDRSLIRAKAERFAASHCADTIAQCIAAMI